MNKKTILVVEDDHAQRSALADTCSRAGFAVAQAAEGESGLETALREHPDLIMLDLLMPKKDGMQFLAELREDAWGKTAKVIILSNVSDTEKIAEAMEHQTFDYLVKSDIAIDAVVSMIQARLGMANEDKAV
jgi:DNA-binding response OmpR family regulator